MKRRTIAICALAALAVASCRRNQTDGRDPRQIIISSFIDGTDGVAVAPGATSSKAMADATKPITGIQLIRRDKVEENLQTIDFTDAIPVSGTRAAGLTAGVTFDVPETYDVMNEKTSYFVGYHPAGVLDQATDVVTWEPDGTIDILYSGLHNAGKYLAPKADAMIFHHALARLEIVLMGKSGQQINAVRDAWGTITKIVIKDILPEMTYAYNAGVLRASGTAGDVELLRGKNYIKDDTDASANGVIGENPNDAVKFASMIVATTRKAFELEITNTVGGDELVSNVSFTLDQNMSAGKVHTVKIAFGSIPPDIEVLGSTVQEWDTTTGGTGGGGITNPQAAFLVIDGVKWATGNLIADGANGAKIGEPTDGGLYFQFGSLIGYKGGNVASNGTGRGIPHGATTTDPMPDTKYWNQAATYSWANDAMVWPQTYTNGAATWPQNLIANSYYFGLQTPPYSSAGQKLSAFPDWESGGLVNTDVAVGDPCRYYLGGGWRMPTAEDWGKLFNSVYANGPVGGTWPGLDKSWVYGTATKTVMAGITSSNSATEGVGIYANTTATTEAAAKADPGALFFPASGYRHASNGSFNYVGRYGYCWSGSVYNATYGFNLLFYTTNVYPQYTYNRSIGFPVRCVSEP